MSIEVSASSRCRASSSTAVVRPPAGVEQVQQRIVRVHLGVRVAADPVDPGQGQPDLGGQRLGERDQPRRPGEPDEGAVDGEVRGGQLAGLGAEPATSPKSRSAARQASRDASSAWCQRCSPATSSTARAMQTSWTATGSSSVTWTPRFGSRVASPSATSYARASRTVERETPIASASATSRSGVPAAHLPVEQCPPQLVGGPFEVEECARARVPKWLTVPESLRTFRRKASPADDTSRGPRVGSLDATWTGQTYWSLRLTDNPANRPTGPTSRGGDDGTARLGPALPDGRAEPLPGGLRDQPVHGPARAAGPRPAPVRQWQGLVDALRSPGADVEVLAAATGLPGHGLRDEPRASCSTTGRARWCSRTCGTPSAGWRR